MYSDNEKEKLTKSVTFRGDNGKDVVEEMRENWKLYISKTTAKSKSHTAASRYWNKINKSLLVFIVLLGVSDTFLALLPKVPSLLIAGVAALFTLAACILAFLRPAEKRQIHIRSSHEFQSLMLRMVRCKSSFEYDELWQDFNKTVFEEPFLRRRHIYPFETVNNQWTMSQELNQTILRKKEELRKMAKQYVNRSVGTTTNMVSVEPNFHLNNVIGRDQRPINFQMGNHPNIQNTQYAIETPYGNRRRNDMEHQMVVSAPADEAFEMLVSEESSQGIAIWGEGKQKKKQTFQQLKRSQTTLN